ncbi:MAG: cyanophycinase [Streptosporangiaceae bacterium]
MVIGGAEDRTGDCELLRVFAECSGGTGARIALITTASGAPDALFAEYSAAFRRYGVPDVCELRLSSRDECDGERTRTALARATGVFFTGGDQSRLGPLAGSRANLVLRDRLAAGTLVVAGTSAGATALGQEMILGGDADRPRTGPGLSLLPEVVVDMHFTQRRRLPRLMAAVCQRPSLLGIGIDEGTAILVRRGRFEVLGNGTVTTVEAQGKRPDVRVRVSRAGGSFDLEGRRPLS